MAVIIGGLREPERSHPRPIGRVQAGVKVEESGVEHPLRVSVAGHQNARFPELAPVVSILLPEQVEAQFSAPFG